MFFPFYITIHSKQFNSKVAVARMKKYIRQTWTINSAILNTMNNFILTPSQSPCPRIYLDGLKSSNIGKVSWLHRTNCGGFRFRRFLCAVISIARLLSTPLLECCSNCRVVQKLPKNHSVIFCNCSFQIS